MRLNCAMKWAWILCLSSSVLSCCGNASDENTAVENRTQAISHEDSIRIKIFGVETPPDMCSVAKNLESAGILKIDKMMVADGKFECAIVEFAGVKFGMNRGYNFVTSRHDKAAIDQLVAKISEFYGDPEIDDEQEDPESRYYHWNLYDTVPGKPYIRIRPIHSEEGGLSMMWFFR